MSQTNGKLPEGCEWKEPPESKRGKGAGCPSKFWAPIAALLRCHPNRWLFIGRRHYGNLHATIARHGLEAATRRQSPIDHKSDVYVRYVEPVPAPLVDTPAEPA